MQSPLLVSAATHAVMPSDAMFFLSSLHLPRPLCSPPQKRCAAVLGLGLWNGRCVQQVAGREAARPACCPSPGSSRCRELIASTTTTATTTSTTRITASFFVSVINFIHHHLCACFSFLHGKFILNHHLALFLPASHLTAFVDKACCTCLTWVHLCLFCLFVRFRFNRFARLRTVLSTDCIVTPTKTKTKTISSTQAVQ